MSMDYVRRYYGVPAKKGGRVSLEVNRPTGLGPMTRLGTITSATHYILVRFDDVTFSVPVHPKEDGLRYL